VSGDRRLRQLFDRGHDREDARAKDVGADAALVVVPYYNKPSQAGLAAISAIAESSDLPIVVYNVPRGPLRTFGRNPCGDCEAPTIVGIKDATGNLGRVSASGCAAARTSASFPAMTTWPWASTPWAASGASPSRERRAAPLRDFQSATREGRWDDALKLQDRLYPLHAALFSDASPGPTKYALTGCVRATRQDCACP
jgi:4-hydroxy-tetrahydrodipicolinate synthase